MVKRVLIVEDERDVAELVSDILELEGYSSRIASGETALDEALQFRPDVVMLDLMMPDVDGFEVARRFHAHPQTREVVIVLMTAMHDAAARAEEVGTPYFVAKPFDIAELVRTLEAALG